MPWYAGQFYEQWSGHLHCKKRDRNCFGGDCCFIVPYDIYLWITVRTGPISPAVVYDNSCVHVLKTVSQKRLGRHFMTSGNNRCELWGIHIRMKSRPTRKSRLCAAASTHTFFSTHSVGTICRIFVGTNVCVHPKQQYFWGKSFAGRESHCAALSECGRAGAHRAEPTCIQISGFVNCVRPQTPDCGPFITR